MMKSPRFRCPGSAGNIESLEPVPGTSGWPYGEWNPRDKFYCGFCGKSVGIYGVGSRDLYAHEYHMKSHYKPARKQVL
jgi:hypothetical protein